MLISRPVIARHLPVVVSLSLNGEMTASNLQPKGVGVVEWAPTLDGPWTNPREPALSMGTGVRRAGFGSVPAGRLHRFYRDPQFFGVDIIHIGIRCVRNQ